MDGFVGDGDVDKIYNNWVNLICRVRRRRIKDIDWVNMLN